MKSLLLAVALFISIPGVVLAQASRTWVSGVGDDANPCSRTAPCKTWAGAIAKTLAGGEINALDPGGFGAVTITKSITLDGGSAFASVLAAGTHGIVVSGANTDVTLRNISMQGIGSGLSAIRHIGSGTLHVHNVQIRGFGASSAASIDLSPTGALNATLADVI